MSRRRIRILGLVFAGALPLTAFAQAPNPAPPPPPVSPPAAPSTPPTNPPASPDPAPIGPPPGVPAAVGGLPGADFIILKASGPGTTLRYGGIVPASEVVTVNGAQLVRGTDYVMDYASGVVYLEFAQRGGQYMTVTYRYIPRAANAPSAFTSAGAFKYDIAPKGSFSILLGVGMADRGPNGQIASSNYVGFDNHNRIGQTTISGVVIGGQRSRMDEEPGLEFDTSNKLGNGVTQPGESSFIAETATTKVAGGTAELDYQKISRGFSGFGMLQGAGYSDADINRMEHERGFTRMGESLTDLKFGGLTLSEGYHRVGDGDAHIDSGMMAVTDGPFKGTWTSEAVGEKFTRFKDLSETNHDQLAKAVGLQRQDWSGQFEEKMGKLQFNASQIEDMVDGSSVHRQEAKLDTSNIKFDIGQQDVSQNFSHFQGLMAGEQAMYGHEAGMHRQWLSLQGALMGSSMPFAYSQSLVGTRGGDVTARDASLGGRGWTIMHIERGMDTGFTGLTQLSAPEIDANAKAIARMYGPSTASAPGDRAGFLAGVGIHRSYTDANVQATKDWNIDFSKLDLKGEHGSGDVTSATVASKNATFSYKHEDLGERFTEVTTLMGFEQKQLGNISGMDRTDMSASLTDGTKKLDMSHMMASTPTGEASRDSVAYHDKGMDLTLNQHSVDAGFTNVSQLVSPDSGLMGTMIGFRETDGNLKWQILPGLNVAASIQDAVNRETNQASRLDQVNANWNLDPSTKITFYGLEQSNHDPLSTIFADNIQRLTIQRSLGRYGILTYMDDQESFSHGQSNNEDDYHTQYFSYEVKLTPKTSVKAEESVTQFSNGETEKVNADTISTAITPRMGVSLTDVNVDRSGSEQTPDSQTSHRNAGVWYDFGHGLVFSYGYARNLALNDGGTTMNSVSIGNNPTGAPVDPSKIGALPPGTVGDFSVTGGYGTNQWDAANRTQSFSNVSVAAVKPFQLGPLTNMKFIAQEDTAADYASWVKEDRNFVITGNAGPNAFGLLYKSQLAQSDTRAIDRGFTIVTDPSNQRWFNAAIVYKARTLPDDKNMLIRSYTLTARILPRLTLSNQLQTDPEIAQPNALLGSVAQATRSDKWKLDYITTPNLTLGGSWEELANDASHTQARTAGVNAKLFDSTGSPMTLFYGMEQSENPTLTRQTSRYSAEFDQRCGPNQLFSVFVGNITYLGNIPTGFQMDNWTVRLNYQWRF